jgi:site-specific DNA recombinase
MPKHNGDETLRAQAVETLRQVIDYVEITPKPGTGKGRKSPGVNINVVGFLAGMLQLATGGTSREQPPKIVQTAVVAGAGFEPTTFRL